MVKVLIVDDHKIFRQGLNSLLNLEKNITPAHASDIPDCLAYLKKHYIDIVLLDVSMPIINGLEGIPLIRMVQPDIKIILLTMHDDIPTLREALKLDVEGYLIKNVCGSELIAAITQVYNGGKHFCDEISTKTIEEYSDINRIDKLNFTSRELDVFLLLAEGYENKEIAEMLFINVSTVRTHRKNLLYKSGCNNVVKLIRFGIENKLIE